MKQEALLIIGISEKDANLYYASRFLAPDPFALIIINDRKIIITSDLEIDRAKKESCADTVLSTSLLRDSLKKQGKDDITYIDLIDKVLKEFCIESLVVPYNFWIEYADGLRQKGYKIHYKREPFFKERIIKRPDEVDNIRETLRAAEKAMNRAIRIIADADVKNGLLYSGGTPLTSEIIKREILVELLLHDCIAERTIVSCGEQTCDPHDEGRGPLHADQPIIIDIFPKSLKNRYHADITRTVVKGRASERLKRMYEVVIEAQNKAFQLIKDGAEGSMIHKEVLNVMEKRGFLTGYINGRMQGFFHG
ncbi:MAG: M24 family metallopeptidase, partial [Candidatus Aenigmatarchaeota archaeon]